MSHPMGMAFETLKFYLECHAGMTCALQRTEDVLWKNAKAFLNNWKQYFYNDVLSGKTKYYSNLIKVEE